MNTRILAITTGMNKQIFIPQIKVKGMIFSSWRSIGVAKTTLKLTSPEGIVLAVSKDEVESLVISQGSDYNMDKEFHLDSSLDAESALTFFNEMNWSAKVVEVVDNQKEETPSGFNWKPNHW